MSPMSRLSFGSAVLVLTAVLTGPDANGNPHIVAVWGRNFRATRNSVKSNATTSPPVNPAASSSSSSSSSTPANPASSSSSSSSTPANPASSSSSSSSTPANPASSSSSSSSSTSANPASSSSSSSSTPPSTTAPYDQLAIYNSYYDNFTSAIDSTDPAQLGATSAYAFVKINDYSGVWKNVQLCYEDQKITVYDMYEWITVGQVNAETQQFVTSTCANVLRKVTKYYTLRAEVTSKKQQYKVDVFDWSSRDYEGFSLGCDNSINPQGHQSYFRRCVIEGINVTDTCFINGGYVNGDCIENPFTIKISAINSESAPLYIMFPYGSDPAPTALPISGFVMLKDLLTSDGDVRYHTGMFESRKRKELNGTNQKLFSCDAWDHSNYLDAPDSFNVADECGTLNGETCDSDSDWWRRLFGTPILKGYAQCFVPGLTCKNLVADKRYDGVMLLATCNSGSNPTNYCPNLQVCPNEQAQEAKNWANPETNAWGFAQLFQSRYVCNGKTCQATKGTRFEFRQLP